MISPDVPWGWLDEEVSVYIRAGHPVGGGTYEYGDGYFRQRSKSSSGDVVVRVPVHALVFGEIAARPAVIRVAAEVMTAAEHRVRLEPRTGGALTIKILHAWAEVIYGDGGARAHLEVRVEPLPAGGRELVVAVLGRRAGRVRGAIVIETDVVGEEQLVIPITGAVRRAGAR